MTARKSTTAAPATETLGLPAGSLSFFTDLANDAGNWGGNPWFSGNIASGRSASGFVGRLVKAGLIESHTDGSDAFCVFTDEGIRAAGKLGIDLTWIREVADVEVVGAAKPAVEAAKAVKPAKASKARKSASKAKLTVVKEKAAPVKAAPNSRTDIKSRIKVARDRRWRAGRRDDAALVAEMDALIVSLIAERDVEASS